MSESTHYDVVIVGAGIAGGLVALELGRAGKRVLILEAGPKIPPDRGEYMENFYLAAAKTPEAPYPPLPDPETGDPVDPATLNAPRVTILRESSYRDPKKSYLTYTSGTRPFGSTYERVGGGTTWHWSGTCLRLFPNSFRLSSAYKLFAPDIHDPARRVNIDWPLSYDDLRPDYDRANELIGVAGSRAEQESLGLAFDADFPMPPVPLTRVDEAFKAADGVTIDDAPDQELRVTATPQGRNTVPYPETTAKRRVCAGNTNCIPICPIQAKYDATVTLNDALDTGNVDILYQSVASRVNVDSDGRVSGIDYLQYDTQSGPSTGGGTATGTLYVLAAHAIETPKLLLNSKTDALPDGVANSSGQVGRNLMDHVMYLTWAQAAEPVWPYRGPLATSGFETLRDGPFRGQRAAWRIEIGNEGWNWAVGDPYTSLIDFVDGLDKSQTNPDASRRLFGPDLYQAINTNLTRQVRMGYLIEQDPDPSMRVIPDPDGRADHLGITRPCLDGYGISRYSQRGFVAAKAASARIWAAMGVRKSFDDVVSQEKAEGPGPYFTYTDEDGHDHYFKYYGAGHIMGTYRMGSDPKQSVLDATQRSHDHDNLYMLGSGVFPSTGTANPTLTIAALALRAARSIRTALGG